MKVRILKDVDTPLFACKAGDTPDLDDERARVLIKDGKAELFKAPAQAPEATKPARSRK